MHRPFLSKISFVLSLMLVVFTVSVESSRAEAFSYQCESLFQNVFQKLPKASEIAKPSEGEVESRAGQATVVYKIKDVLPPGHYEVIVRGLNENSKPYVLTVSYSVAGARFELDSTMILQTSSIPFKVSKAEGSEGNVFGLYAHMNLQHGQVVLVNSVFTGNQNSPSGFERRDTSIELTLTKRRPVVLTLKEQVVRNSETGESVSEARLDYTIEIVRRVP